MLCCMRYVYGWALGAWFTALAACGGESDSEGGSGGTGGSGGATGGSGGATGGSGGGGYLDCFDASGKLSAYDLKTCTGDTCVVVEHQTDCCGNTLLVGVESANLAKLQACETAWRATLPGCGCPAGPPTIEQPSGTTVTSKDAAKVTCGNWTSTSGICITEPK